MLRRPSPRTLACLLALCESLWLGSGWVLLVAGWIILVGSLATCGTRTRAIATRLEARP